MSKYGALMDWWGTEAAESDPETGRRQLGRSRQYMARYARYAYPWQIGGMMKNMVEITICTAKHIEVAKIVIHKKLWDTRPVKTPQAEVEWAAGHCGIEI